MLLTQYQQFIHLSRYARWNSEEYRRETWPETVDRYFGFFIPHLNENHSAALTAGDVAPLRDAVHDLDILPSMRCLMTAGPALARDHIAGYNPVAGETLVLTQEHGLVPIEQLVGSTATVLNKDGRWADAEFKGYGEQPTYAVNLKLNSNTVKAVTCTGNHRWILQDGTVRSTEALRAGDRIDFVSAPRPAIDDDYRLGVIHGLVYGDGTTTYSCKRVKGYHIRLCSDAGDLLPWFDGYPVSYPPTYGGDPIVYLYDGFAKTHDLKALPSVDETPSYLMGFIRGWMAADGSISKAGQVSICTKEGGKWWLEHIAAKIGFVVQRTAQQNNTTNLGQRTKPSWLVFFSRSSMVAEDFLIARKRDRFKPLESHFVVTDITPTGRVESVYCAEVPDTNTFVLDMGLVTGNCAYVPIDNVRAFDEILFILACATGVGFSVERQYVNQLPVLPECLDESGVVITVRDSKRGWAEALRELLGLLFAGRIPKWDTTKVRPAGARLKTMGGRASGPEPLERVFEFTVRTFKHAVDEGQKRLNSLQCHDIVCIIGECIVVGGVRRSALISLSNLSDQRMRDCKSGEWWHLEPQRRLANNSVAYTETPEVGQWMEEWLSLYKSKSGERGVFNRTAAIEQAMKNGRRKGYRTNGVGDVPWDFGVNPCGEIILRPMEFCNLTTTVVTPEDSPGTLEEKVRLATILGTWQSTLTNFRYIRKGWQTNCEEERLLGVSMTGIMSNMHLMPGRAKGYTADLLDYLRETAISTNKEWANRLGIPQSTAVTCIKPEGTASQLVGGPSGMHPEYAKHYIRRVRQDKKDPLTQLMIDEGVPWEEDKMNPEGVVFSFPKAAPEGCITRHDLTAKQQLDHWLTFRNHWCEHNPSITIDVKEKEWPGVGAWVWDHFDDAGGLTFMPSSDHSYPQAPYEEITEPQFEAEVSHMPEIQWEKLGEYESEDNTTGGRELACLAGACTI